MRKDELLSAMKFEAEKYIPFHISDSIIDCVTLEKLPSGQQRVLLVAAKKKIVHDLMNLLKEIGLEINVVDVDSFALMNSFQNHLAGDSKDEKGHYALLNMGSTFSNMNIVKDKKVYFTRDILWGGGKITARIKDAMIVSLEEAEALKRNPGQRKNEIAEVIAPVLGRLASQVAMSFDYFESQFGETVDKLYISGGTSNLFNAVDFFKNSLGIDAIGWNPFDGINVSGEQAKIEKDPALFSVAVGLSLRR